MSQYYPSIAQDNIYDIYQFMKKLGQIFAKEFEIKNINNIDPTDVIHRMIKQLIKK